MIGIVSTFSEKNYKDYAFQFIETAKKFIDKNIKIYLYVDSNIDNLGENFKQLNLEECNPELTAFKLRHKDKDETNFLYAGKRFSHKSYAIYHCSLHSDVDKLFWFDADTVFQQSITSDYLTKFLPNNTFTCYLGRPGRYTETGFLGFDLKHSGCKEFMEKFIAYYNNDTIYNLVGQLDCHVYDATREQMVAENKITAKDLTPGMGKSNFNFIHKGFAVHNKGENKLGIRKKNKKK